MKTLIYTLAMGSDAWHQAVMMAHSFRTRGQYEGDLVVYTDQYQCEMSGATVIYKPDLTMCFSIMGARWLLGEDLDVTGYDKVAMIDADVLAINPVADLFGFDFDGVMAPEEFPDGRVFHGNSPWSIHGVPFDQNLPVHNCGIVIGPASLWNSFSSTMWDTVVNIRGRVPMPYIWIDQQALNHLIRCGSVPFSQIPMDWVYMFKAGRGLTPNTKLIHVLPNGKERMMRVIYSMINDEHKATT